MASFFFQFGLFLSIILPFSVAYNFNVGGKNGWTLNPSEDYNHWAERNRFQVNDTLTFRYKKGADSALVVKKDDYYKCNTNNPIVKFDSGTSVFKFDRSGPFFFISGNQQNCRKGQRLIVVVLAVRPPKSPSTPPANSPSSSVSPSPGSNSPSSSVSPSPAANSPQSDSPSPSSFLPPSPAANSPESSSTPTVAPTPASTSPESSSSPTVSPAPAANSPGSSAPSPAASSPGSSSPSPAASSPGSSSPSGAPGTSPAADSPEGGLAPDPASDSGETADVNSPAPTKSGSPAVTASKGMMVTAVGVVILGFVIV